MNKKLYMLSAGIATTAGVLMLGVGTAFASDISTSTINTDIVQANISQLKDVAGNNLPLIFGVAVLIALAFVAYRWFKRLTGVHK